MRVCSARLHRVFPASRLRHVAAPWLALTCLLVGCGGGAGPKLDRHAVSGSVTLDGKPLDQGTIRFEPAANVKERTAAGAPIQNGQFTLPKDQGLPPGNYVVSISSSEPAPPAPSDPAEAMAAAAKAPVKPDRIPTRYNQSSELRAEVKSGENKLEFPLTSAKAK